MVSAQMSASQKCLTEHSAAQLSPPLSPGIGKENLSGQISKTKREFHWLKTRLVFRLRWVFGASHDGPYLVTKCRSHLSNLEAYVRAGYVIYSCV